MGGEISRELFTPAITGEHFSDGAVSIIGTYLHGLFGEQSACNALLHWAGFKEANAIDYHALQETEIDRLADAIEQYINVSAILELLDQLNN